MSEESFVSASLQEHQQAMLLLLKEFDRICKSLSVPYSLFAGTLLGSVRHKGFIPWDDDADVIMLREDYERFLQNAEQLLDKQTFYLQKEYSDHWPMYFSKLRLNNTVCLEKYHPKDEETHQGVYIDIFPCDNAAKTAFGRMLQFICSKVVIAKGLDRRGYDTDSVKKKIFIRLCRFLPVGFFLKACKRGRADSQFVHSFLGGSSSFTRGVYPRNCIEETACGEFCGNEFPISGRHGELLTILYGDYMRLPSQEEIKCKQHAILVDLTASQEKYRDYRKGMKFDIHTRSIR